MKRRAKELPANPDLVPRSQNWGETATRKVREIKFRGNPEELDGGEAVDDDVPDQSDEAVHVRSPRAALAKGCQSASVVHEDDDVSTL